MQKFVKIASLAVVASMLAACGGHGGAIPSQTQSTSSLPGTPNVAYSTTTNYTDRSQWKPMYTVMPLKGVDHATLLAQRDAGTTLPFFSGSIKSPVDGNTYSYDILGKDPHSSTTATQINVVPIVLILKFPGGVTLDPTKPACNDTVSVENRFYKGPNFVSTPLKSNGISVGTVQINDGDQRAEFWSLVNGNGWHTHLKLTTSTPIVVTKTAPSGSTAVSGACSGSNHDLGEIDYNAYNNMITGIFNAHATPSQFPMILTYNVVQTSGGCCIIGYHGAYSRSTGTQVFAVGAYTDQLFQAAAIRDIHAWTHEIGEAMNDPFVNNATPAWGHVGQVSGCQNNLEVGDPLTGTAFPLTYNGFHYHPQELTFFDWFFRTPAEGTGGKFSFEGTFTSDAGPVCV